MTDAERNAVLEEAAKLCEERATTWDGDPPEGQEVVYAWRCEEAENCAHEIRKLKSTTPQKDKA